MKLFKDHYAELISLTQLFLLREHSLKEIKTVDPAIFDFFRRNTKLSSSDSKKIQAPFPQPEVNKIQLPARPAIVPKPADSRPIEPRREQIPSPPQTSVVQSNVVSSSHLVHDKTNKEKKWILEPLTSVSPQEMKDWWNLAQTLFPEWTLNKAIPSDAIAQKNKNAWVKNQEISPVMILSFHDNDKQQALLKNIAQAITLRLAPAQVISAFRIEKENGWEKMLNSPQLRLIIASDYELYLNPKLMQFYKEVPQQGKHFLNQIPLLLLSDLSLYLKEPQLKTLLWRAICNEFAISQSHHSRLEK